MGKELLFSVTKNDFEITWYSGKGAGGQHRNKHMNCCRIKHKETGIMATGQNQRSREQNRKDAFTRLVNSKKFKDWLRIKTSQEMVNTSDIVEKVDREMDMSQLKFEFMYNGVWVP